MISDKTELISRCKVGDSQALDLLYQHYRPMLLNVCKHYTKEDGVADDLLHDAFVIILTSLDKLEQTDNLESWMTSIVRNVGYHYRQYAKKEKNALRQIALEKRTSIDETQTYDYYELQALISRLPQGYQQVFRLSVFEGFSHKEISDLLGIAPHSSSSQLSHAKRMLRQLVKQLWALSLVLVAIPMVVWWFLHKQTFPEAEKSIDGESNTNLQFPISVIEKEEKPFHNHAPSPALSSIGQNSRVTQIARNMMQPACHSKKLAISLDSARCLPADSLPLSEKESIQPQKDYPKDTIPYSQTHWQPLEDIKNSQSAKTICSSNVSLAYNGLFGRNRDFMAAATIDENTSGGHVTSTATNRFSNWIDFYNYLNTNVSIQNEPETHSLIRIASQNIKVNNGAMKARYEHQLPITFQLTASHHLSTKASVETGLSYTQLNSIITTGSANANIQERQKLHYVGIPLRFGWQWYNNVRLSIYSTAGTMLELPIHSTVSVRHFINGSNTFQKEMSPYVPVQWSVSLGLGAQCNLTPHFSFYIEPSLQYFFNNRSNIKTYRTEHPLEMTFPIGLRFNW